MTTSEPPYNEQIQKENSDSIYLNTADAPISES